MSQSNDGKTVERVAVRAIIKALVESSEFKRLFIEEGAEEGEAAEVTFFSIARQVQSLRLLKPQPSTDDDDMDERDIPGRLTP